MVWILLGVSLWIVGCLVLLALMMVAARSDRHTSDEVARLRRAAFVVYDASTGSKAWSLTSVSASSAAGSESRTTPTPA